MPWIRIAFKRCLVLLHISLFLQGEAMENCTGNVYLDKDLGLCLPCSSCDDFSIQLKECTTTSNTVCLKCAGDDKEKNPECERCRPCRKGHFLSSPCTPESANTCQRCRKGSYSAKPSFSTRCLSCLDCKKLNRKVVRPCKAHKDAVCGKCKKGYYEVSGVQKCLPCRPCVSGSLKVKACLRWGGERRCGFVLHRTRHSKYGTIMKHDIQATTDSLVTNVSTEHLTATPRPARRKVSLKVFIIVLSISMLTILVIILGVARAVLKNQRKKAAKTIIADEEKFLIRDKRDTEAALIPNGHFVSVYSSKGNVIKPYLSSSDPGERSLCQNALLWNDLLSSSRETSPERYLESQPGYVANVKRTLPESTEISSLASAPEPLQPPPPPPLRTAFFNPPEIPPRRQHDFKTL